jgi:hypothetical protein
VRATVLLADAAEALNGKLYILGGGWSITGPGPVPFAIAIKIEVPWDRANERHTLTLTLLDGDGHQVPVEQAPDAAPEPLVIRGDFEVGRPVGVPRGTPLDSVFAINFGGGLALPPGARYEWRVEINEETRAEWTVGFTTRPAPPGGVS